MTKNFFHRTSQKAGFTIVELLIVIIVIGILFSVAAISYNGVQKNALNTHKLAAMSDWKDLFQLYASKNGGKYPTASVSSPQYCLGENFTFDACWNVYDVYGTTGVYGSGPKPTEPVAKIDAQLNTQLKTVGKLPSPSTCIVSWYCPVGPSDGVGPMVSYRNGKPTVVWDFFLGGSCPGRLEVRWTDGNASTCQLRISTVQESEITNLATNPSAETGATTWAAGPWGVNGAGQFTNQTTGGANGVRHQRMRWTQAATWTEASAPYIAIYPTAQVQPGQLYTCSAATRSSLSTGRVSMRIAWVNSVGTWISQSAGGESAITSAWTGIRQVHSAVAPASTATAVCIIRLSNLSAIANNATFDVDSVMFVEGEDTFVYADGASLDWTWLGTPHASMSKGPAL